MTLTVARGPKENLKGDHLSARNFLPGDGAIRALASARASSATESSSSDAISCALLLVLVGRSNRGF